MASLSEEAENETLREALRKAKRKLAQREDDREAIIAAIKEAVGEAALAVGRAGPVPRPERDRRRGPEVAVLHLTDLQLGKETSTYSTEVCKERIDRAVRRALKIAEVQRADHPVRSIELLLGGDLVEGVGVYPGQEFEVDSTNYVQLLEAKALVERVVLTLLEGFEHVTVHEVTGNHGRIGRRGDNPREFNLDRLVYTMARESLSNQARMTWAAPDPKSWFTVVTVGAYRALLVHGDQIKSFGGNLPAYGILRKANAWASGAVPEPFSDIFMGHFHTPMQLTMANGSTVWVTGSPESDNEYAREFVAARGRPSQRLLFVDSSKGRVTADYVLWLDD